MPSTLYTIVMNFVTNRVYKLKVDGVETRHTIMTTSSVPQGSHCGPILFLLMTADMVQCTRSVYKVRSYCQRLSTNGTNAIRSRINFMKINETKTYHVRYQKRNSQHIQTHYFVGNKRIERVSVVKDLGVLFDEHLTFVPHIEKILMSANRLFGMSRRLSYEIRSPSLIMKLFQTYVTPILEYCPLVWSREKNSQNQQLETHLHRATWIALGSLLDRHIGQTKRDTFTLANESVR